MNKSENMKEINLKIIENTLRAFVSEEDLRPYIPLGNGLYELPGNIIINKKGLEQYLKAIEE